MFNPTAYVLIGIADARSKAARTAAEAGGAEGDRGPMQPSGVGGWMVLRTTAQVVLGLRKNMLVVSSLLGFAYRATLGSTLPWYLSYSIDLLGQPFAPLVYLIGGFGFVGSASNLKTVSAAAMPCAIVALKSVLLPIVSAGAVTWFAEKPTQFDMKFLFLYSLLPCANSALVIARMYGANGQLLATLSAALSLNKLCAFLLILFAGVIASAGSADALMNYKDVLSLTMLIISSLGTFWLCASNFFIPPWRRCRKMRSLSLHFALQFALATTFVSIAMYVKAGSATGRPQMHTRAFAIGYGAISTLRWTCNGSALFLALDWLRCTRPGATAKKSSMGLLSHLAASLTFGLAMTLPFVLGATGQPKPRQADIGTDWWVAYGDNQALAYCVAYGVLTALSVGSLAVILVSKFRERRRSQTSAGVAPLVANGHRVNGRPPAERLPTLAVPRESVSLVDPIFMVDVAPQSSAGPLRADPYPYPLRLCILLTCATIHLAGQSGICANMMVDNDASAPNTMVEPLLVMVMLEDGQGFISFLLFGLMSVHMKILRSCLVSVESTPATPTAAGDQRRPLTQEAHVLSAYVARGGTTSSSSRSEISSSASLAEVNLG